MKVSDLNHQLYDIFNCTPNAVNCDIELIPVCEEINGTEILPNISLQTNDGENPITKLYIHFQLKDIVAPVKEAEWVDNRKGCFRCSNCGRKAKNSKELNDYAILTPYCPYCGAKMKLTK